MKKINLNINQIFILFSIFIILIKIYTLFINPVPFGSFILALNTQIFFNIKSFNYLPQSYVDWNHPGTPLYILAYFIHLIIGDFNIKNFKNFTIFYHFLFLAINLFSIYSFLNFFKQRITNIKILLIFVLIMFSFDTNLLSLEVIDYTSLYFSIILFLLIAIFRFIENQNLLNTFLISLTSIFSMSLMMAFLPLSLSIILFATFSLFKNKNFKKLFFFYLFCLINLFLFNLPIIGRIPKIIYNVIFSRYDTVIDQTNIFGTIKDLLLFFINNNIFLLIIIILFILLGIKFNYYNFKINKLKFLKYKDLFLLQFLILIFFIYTLLVAAEEISSNQVFPGIILRNNYIYIVFVFFILMREELVKNKINFLILVSILSFLTNNLNYFSERNEIIKNYDSKNKIFYEEIYKYKKNNFDKLLIYSDIGYGFENFSILARGHNIFGTEKFNYEMMEAFPDLRYLRLNDWHHNNISKLYNPKTFILYERIDKFLLKHLPNKIYLMLSHKSFEKTSSWFGSEDRSKELFINKGDDKIQLAIFNKTHHIKNSNDYIKLIHDIKIKTKLKKSKKIEINGDEWYLVY